MPRSVLLLLFAVLLPGSLSHALYSSLFSRDRAPDPITGPVEPRPIRIEITEVVPAAAWEDRVCQASEERPLSLSASARDHLSIRAGTGSLQVRGVEDGDQVRVRALLCASDLERLTAMDVELRRVMGPDLRLETKQPDPDGALGWSDDEYARIDLVIDVPQGMETRIEDGSGPMTVTAVGELFVRDGAGEIEVQGVLGNVRIEDGSGSLRLKGVVGDVELLGGSGAVVVQGVTGSVVVAEADGHVDISGVAGDVSLPESSTAAYDVFLSQIGGDVLVRAEETGSLQYNAIGGRVVATGAARPR